MSGQLLAQPQEGNPVPASLEFQYSQPGLFIEQRQGYVSARAVWSDRYDSYTKDPEINPMAYDVIRLGAVIKSEQELVSPFGFSTRESRQTEEIKVEAPSTELLNRTRLAMARQTGIHTGRFVDFEGARLTPTEYADLLAKREIPGATKPPLIVHDLEHRTLQAGLAETVFSRFVKGSQRAVSQNDQQLAEDVVRAFDGLSWARIRNPELLAQLYSGFMHPRIAGVRASRDAREQQKTHMRIALLPPVRR